MDQEGFQMKTVIVYGSTTGVTEAVAQDVAAAFDRVDVIVAGDATAEALAGVDLLVLGASTWGIGDLQDDMDAFLGQFSGMDVSAKAGAVFGLGDAICYGDSFVDGVADMADALKNKDIKVVGAWPVDGYGFSASRAQDGDHFVGLAIDQENDFDKTVDRIVAWTKLIKEQVGS
jgi:flavodoxin I